MKEKVYISTLGCKVNQFESAAFKTGFEEAGFAVISKHEIADIVVINTCAVTGTAGAQSRQAIRKALRKSPNARILITGCYAELAAEELKKQEDLKSREYAIIGNSNKDQLVPIALTGASLSSEDYLGNIQNAADICRLPVKRFGQRSRAYLRVQDGCESFCSYCIVPFTRGPSRSLPADEVVEQAKIFADEGHKEIVVTGIHLGYYGKEFHPRQTVVTLLDKLTQATPSIHYRISSLEPLEITEDLLSLMQQRSNIQPHFHIPLQAGDDEILQKMNRRYTTAQFRQVLDNCHSQLPDLAVGIDVLAGFPGEEEHHFKNALSFLEDLSFSYLHVFPYSIRPGTQAATFKNQISKKIKDERVSALRELSERKRNIFYNRHLGQTRTVLVEGQRDSKGRLKGFTDNYIAVRFNGPDALLNNFIKVDLRSFEENYVIGETASP